MTKIKEGEMVWSTFFNDWVKVVKVYSDTDWYFQHRDRVDKAVTPLHEYEGWHK